MVHVFFLAVAFVAGVLAGAAISLNNVRKSREVLGELKELAEQLRRQSGR